MTLPNNHISTQHNFSTYYRHQSSVFNAHAFHYNEWTHREEYLFNSHVMYNIRPTRPNIHFTHFSDCELYIPPTEVYEYNYNSLSESKPTSDPVLLDDYDLQQTSISMEPDNQQFMCANVSNCQSSISFSKMQQSSARSDDKYNTNNTFVVNPSTQEASFHNSVQQPSFISMEKSNGQNETTPTTDESILIAMLDEEAGSPTSSDRIDDFPIPIQKKENFAFGEYEIPWQTIQIYLDQQTPFKTKIKTIAKVMVNHMRLISTDIPTTQCRAVAHDICTRYPEAFFEDKHEFRLQEIIAYLTVNISLYNELLNEQKEEDY